MKFPWEEDTAGENSGEDTAGENSGDYSGDYSGETSGEKSGAAAGAIPPVDEAAVQPVDSPQDSTAVPPVESPEHSTAVPPEVPPEVSPELSPELSPASSSPRRPVVKKEYYAISEVADLVGLPAHVLRYWESQFSVLSPSKNRSGNRVYQRKEIRLILLVKQLLHEEKYTVEGAKQRLDQLRRGGDLQNATAGALDTQLVQVLREELQAVGRLLETDAE